VRGEKRPLSLALAPDISNPPALTGIKVNDIHSQLNSALVSEVLTPTSIDQCRDILRTVAFASCLQSPKFHRPEYIGVGYF
jgi:hypothetical protein